MADAPGPVSTTPLDRAAPGVPPPRAGPDDGDLVERLRRGDETALATIIAGWSPVMLRVARAHVSTEASCEDIVQETWLAVIRGLPAFEGRSSLRTWVFRILTNLAKTHGVREARSVPMSSISSGTQRGATGPTVDPDRFRPAGDEQEPRGWTPLGAPRPWQPGPEQSAVADETRRLLGEALQELPERQRAVVTLRDVHGLPPDEVCATLDLTAANQRVLLHRGRARLRTVLEDYYRGTGEVSA